MNRWPSIRLGDCCDIVSGATPSTSEAANWGGDICWATPKDLSALSGTYISDTPRKLTRLGLDRCAATVLPPQSVLFSSRAPIGHVAINTVPMATNQGFKSFVPDVTRVEPKYLYWWLRANRSRLAALGNGATFKEVSKAVVSRIEIELASLVEQRRIAAILDQADALRAKCRAAFAQLDALAESIFIDMFGDPVTNPKGWADGQTLDEFAEIASGIAKGRRLNGVSTRVVPYLAVVNVQKRALDLSVVKTIAATESEIEKLRLAPGDLLLTEGGDADKLGRGTLWNNELSECIHQNHIFRVRITAATLRPTFLNWLVSSSRGRQYFLRSAKQTTGIASINMTQLRQFPVLLPPIEYQDCFVERLSVVEGLKTSHRASLASLDALLASLQHRAFRGEL